MFPHSFAFICVVVVLVSLTASASSENEMVRNHNSATILCILSVIKICIVLNCLTHSLTYSPYSLHQSSNSFTCLTNQSLTHLLAVLYSSIIQLNHINFSSTTTVLWWLRWSLPKVRCRYQYCWRCRGEKHWSRSRRKDFS